MPANVEYHRNNRVALHTYHPPLTAAELLAVFDDYAAACQQASQPIHAIGDVTALTSLPPKVLSILRTGTNSPLRELMAGSFVIVTKNPFIKVMVSATSTLMPHVQISVVDTLELAWEKIDQILANEAHTNSRASQRRSVQSR